ncbi:MAG TPA: hypothetical protein V6D29_19080 [Leptolyngbyaceae cyanobacterium]
MSKRTWTIAIAHQTSDQSPKRIPELQGLAVQVDPSAATNHLLLLKGTQLLPMKQTADPSALARASIVALAQRSLLDER